MRVQLFMHTRLETCRPEATLEHAARLMSQSDVGALPVLDEQDRVCGIVTDRDVCMAAYRLARPLREISVASAMSRDVKSCQPSDTIADALALMRHHQVRRLPVTQDGRLVGMLSLSELARIASGAVQHKFGSYDDIVLDDVTRTLAEVSAQRPRADPD